jgi:hypothetical protein
LLAKPNLAIDARPVHSSWSFGASAPKKRRAGVNLDGLEKVVLLEKVNAWAWPCRVVHMADGWK